MPDETPPAAAAHPRILVTEDDPALAEMLRWLFSKEGFEVLQAADGMAALERIRKDRPDVILSDVMLPRMDGFKLCRLVKFDAELKAIPFIFLTARTQDKDREIAQQAGADAYVTKPIQNQALVSLVRKHLR